MSVEEQQVNAATTFVANALGHNMKVFRCHKVVKAGRIRGIERGIGCGTLRVELDGGKIVNMIVANEYFEKHKPHLGGYLVIYEDDYYSFSPAMAFEKGYRELPAEGSQKAIDHDGVDAFAMAMKAKLDRKRVEGMHGWDDPDICKLENLEQSLFDHLVKGDMVDVGNLAMMVFHRKKAAGPEGTSSIVIKPWGDGLTIPARKFHQKRQMVEAIQFNDHADFVKITYWMHKGGYKGSPVYSRPYNEKTRAVTGKPSVKFDTACGETSADPGDWIVRDRNGAFFCLKKGIFEGAYEAFPEGGQCDSEASEPPKAEGGES